MQDRTATDEQDPGKAKRMAFVENRKLRIPPSDGDTSVASWHVVDKDERGRRALFQSRRRLLITEKDPLDGDDVVFNGKRLSEELEEFLKTATTHSRGNTKSYTESIAFTVGARYYGHENEVFDFLRYRLVKQDADRVTLVAHGMRLNFRRILPKKGSARPQWKLESKDSSGSEHSGRRAHPRSMGHGPGRSE